MLTQLANIRGVARLRGAVGQYETFACDVRDSSSLGGDYFCV